VTAVEIYLVIADEWNERARLAPDPGLHAAYTVLAIAHRKLAARLEELSSRSAGEDAKRASPATRFY
jgi:hypothetical protein